MMSKSQRLCPHLISVPCQPDNSTTTHGGHISGRQPSEVRHDNDRTINYHITNVNVFNGLVQGYINKACGRAVDGFVQMNQSNEIMNSPMGKTC
jgi:hypothetical protein